MARDLSDSWADIADPDCHSKCTSIANVHDMIRYDAPGSRLSVCNYQRDLFRNNTCNIPDSIDA